MLIDYFLTQTGVVLRVKCRQDNTGAKPGQGLTGLTSASTGLRIAAAADNEATTTAYTSGTSTIDTIATLGTFAAPTATHCRFKEYDATSHPGVYEVQFENSRFAVASCKSLLCSITGVSGLADCDFVIPLRAVNPYSITFGLSLAKGVNLTGLNDIAATTVVSGGAITTSGGAVSSVTTTTTATNLTNAPTAGDFTATMKSSLNAATPASVQNVSAQTGDAYARIGTNGAGLTALGDTRLANLDAAVSSRSTYTGGDTSGTMTLLARLTSTRAGNLDNLATAPLTTLGANAPANWINAAAVAAAALNGKGDWSTSTSVWDQTTSGHTTSGTFGAAVDAAQDVVVFAQGSVITSTSTTQLTISIPGSMWSATDLVGRFVRTIPTTGFPPEEAPILTATEVNSTTFAVTFASGIYTSAPAVGTNNIWVG